MSLTNFLERKLGHLGGGGVGEFGTNLQMTIFMCYIHVCTCVLFFPSVHVDLVKIVALVTVVHMAQYLPMKEVIDTEYSIKIHVMPDMDEITEREYLNLSAPDMNMMTIR